MAVEFEVVPTSAEVEGKVDPADLANGEPTEAIEAPVTTLEVEPGNPVSLEPGTQLSQVEGDQQPTPTVDPELLSKWEQDCNEATKQHEISIEQTKALMVELDKQISYKTDELKSIKDEKKGAVERLIRLELKGPEFPPKPQPKPIAAASGGASNAGESTEGNTTAADVREPNTDDSWRLIASAQILKGIERLGQKKIGSIVDSYPTLGSLEDLRGEASKQHKHFSEVLPDGIGKTIADKIEERMMDEIAKFSVGLKVVSPPTDAEDEADETDQETGEVITDSAEVDPEYEDVDLADV
jgi:hypothetical protein